MQSYQKNPLNNTRLQIFYRQFTNYTAAGANCRASGSRSSLTSYATAVTSRKYRQQNSRLTEKGEQAEASCRQASHRRWKKLPTRASQQLPAIIKVPDTGEGIEDFTIMLYSRNLLHKYSSLHIIARQER